MAEHFQQMSSRFQETFGGRLYVSERESFWAGGGILEDEKASGVAKVDGVRTVIPMLIGRLRSDRSMVIGMPQVMLGLPPHLSREYTQDARLASGRWLEKGDRGYKRAVVGSDIAYQYALEPGDKMPAQGGNFLVVGVLAHTGSLEDRQMIVPLDMAQKALGRKGLITGMVVLPHDAGMADEVTERIKKRVSGVQVLTPRRMGEEVEQSLRVWKSLIVGAGLVAAATGAMSIIITMLVSVYERQHEIALKKSIGASNRQLVADFLREAAVLGILGWVVGALLALAFVEGWNEIFRKEGTFLFLLTPRIWVTSFFVVVGFALLAGAIPALKAARLDPVAALRLRA